MLSQMQKKEIENTILNINRVNENTYITWDELVESVNHDILSYETMYNKKYCVSTPFAYWQK